MSRRPPQTIEALVLKMHRTRVQAETLRRQMAACECQFERAADMAQVIRIERELADGFDIDRRPDAKGDELKPCWKGHWNHYGLDGSEYVTVGESRPGGWCEPCKKRQTMLKPLIQARRSLGALKGALWRATKKLHDSAQREERR